MGVELGPTCTSETEPGSQALPRVPSPPSGNTTLWYASRVLKMSRQATVTVISSHRSHGTLLIGRCSIEAGRQLSSQSKSGARLESEMGYFKPSTLLLSDPKPQHATRVNYIFTYHGVWYVVEEIQDGGVNLNSRAWSLRAKWLWNASDRNKRKRCRGLAVRYWYFRL